MKKAMERIVDSHDVLLEQDHGFQVLKDLIVARLTDRKYNMPRLPVTLDSNFQRDLGMVDIEVRVIMQKFEDRLSVHLAAGSPFNQRRSFQTDFTVKYLLSQYGLGFQDEPTPDCLVTLRIPESLKNHDHIDDMYRALANCPKRGEVLERTQWYRTGLELENGLVSLWDDSDTLEVDIYNVNALELMAALQVRTVDDLFKAVKERSIGWADSFSKFLDEHGIRYSAYSSVPDFD